AEYNKNSSYRLGKLGEFELEGHRHRCGYPIGWGMIVAGEPSSNAAGAPGVGPRADMTRLARRCQAPPVSPARHKALTNPAVFAPLPQAFVLNTQRLCLGEAILLDDQGNPLGVRLARAAPSRATGGPALRPSPVESGDVAREWGRSGVIFFAPLLVRFWWCSSA